MSKSLTEKWKNGELPGGEYYIKLDDDSFTTDKYYGEGFGFSEEIPVEVLAPVPSYEEYKRLQEQLKEANDIIQTLYKRKECDAFDHLIFREYLEKWGVK